MKKILNALFATLLAVFTFSSCSDVPAPYEIMDEGDLPGLVGNGTKENPYDVASAKQKQDGSEAWVQGYIVGTIENYQDPSGSATFAAPFTANNNILLAASADETNVNNCMPIQLSGDLRTKLNLVDNAGNLGQVLNIKGSLVKFYGFPGLKETTAAVFNGEEIGEDGGTGETGDLAPLLDPSNPVAEVINTFDDAQTDVDYVKEGYVNLAEVGGRTWRGKPFEGNGLIQATAYGSKEASVISWFVTPAVNVAQMQVKKLTFDCISAYYVEGTKLEVYFLEKEGETLKYTQLNVGTLPQQANGYSNPVTLSADLTSVGDKVGFIGFKYIGGGSATGTYQIDNLYVGTEAGTEPTPGNEVVVTKDQPYAESFMDGEGKFTIDNKNLGSLSFVWNHGVFSEVGYMKASAFVNNQNNESESWLVSPVLDLTGLTKAELTFDQAVNHRKGANAADHMMLVATVQGQDNWQPIALTYPEKDSYDYMATTVDLSQYAGQKMQFAFKYVSTTAAAPTWQIQNVKVSAGEGGTEPEPGGGYTSNIELPAADFSDSSTSAYGGNVVIDGTEYPVVKLGTSSKAGSWSSAALPAGVTELSLYALGWSNKTGGLTITIENGGSFEGGATSQTINLDGKTAGITGNPPFKDVTPAATDYYTYKLEGITASSTIKLTSGGSGSDKRAVIFGINVK